MRTLFRAYIDIFFFFFQAEDGIRDVAVTGVQTCALPIYGVTATALLVTFFHELGLQVPYYIPERASEGYGLNADSMRQLASTGVRLLVTVDCGSTACEEVALAHRLGMDIIITDHHQPPERLPDACAVLNPHQPACTYPNKYLCGLGVVFQLLTALRAALRQGA